MKQTAGLVFAFAAASPALAADGGPEPQRQPHDPDHGALTGAIASPEGAAAALDEGRLYLATGNAVQAVSAFRQALAGDLRSVAALNGLGIAYDRLGRSDLARRHFEMALSLEPDAADVAYNLGYSLHLAGNHRDAVPWLQKASGGDDGRAAAAARRLLAVIAARLEALAIAPDLAAPPMNTAPTRVASARIDIASSGEAILVLGSDAPAATIAQPPVLALSVPAERLITAALSVAITDPAALEFALPDMSAMPDAGAAPLRMAQAAPATDIEPSDIEAPGIEPPQRQPLAVRDVMASRLGALAALTIPLAAPLPVIAAPAVPTEAVAPPSVIRAAARAAIRSFARPAPAAAPAWADLPQVVMLGDTAPDFTALAGDAYGEGAAIMPPLRLLDLAALPLLATATPLAPTPLLSPPRLAVDWLAGTDIDHLAPEAAPPPYRRLVNALLAQADLADAVDPRAVRMAISRLEALVTRIQSFGLEVMRA